MRRRDRTSLAITALALGAAVLIIGGVFRWTQALVAVLVAAALASQFSSRRKLDKTAPIVVLLGLATAFTAIQLVPLPAGLIHALNPTGSALRADGAAIAGTAPWPCLSMDPPGTLRALVFFITLCGVAVLSLRIAASERGRFTLIGGVAVACGVTAAITGAHAIVGAESLYGLYTPAHAMPPVLGPLLNPNHLGCLMAFGASLALGLSFYEKQSAHLRAVWIVASIGCAIVALASESRGAAVSLTLGIATTGGVLVARGIGDVTEGRRGRVFKQLPVAFVIILALAIAIFVSAHGVVDQLDRTSLVEIDHPASKFAAWKASLNLVEESPWIGVGRGALEPTFARVFDASGFLTFAHLENEYVSAVVEWGVPASLILAVLFGWCIIVAARRWRDGPLAAGALGSLVGVMFQSSVDYGVELLGVAVPVTMVACTLQIVPMRETSRFARVRLFRILLIAGLVAGAVLMLLPPAHSLEEDHEELVKSSDVQKLRATIQRHPLDYFSFGKTAERMWRRGDGRAVAYLNHALRLHPRYAPIHRLAARVLASSGRHEQASVEYALAMRGTPLPHGLLAEIVTMLPSPADAANSIPVDYFNPDRVLASLTQLKRDDIAERWLTRVADATRDVAQIDRLYKLATARNDLDVALHAARLRLAAARTTTSRLLLARVHYARRDFEAVQAELADLRLWQGRTDERADAWLVLCDSYVERVQWDSALECLRQLDATGFMSSRRALLDSRERNISERREAEAKEQRMQDLQRSINLPDKTHVPVAPPAPKP